MKKVVIFLFIIIVIISIIAYMYINYRANYNIAKRENEQFEIYYNKEINGSNLATVINKAIDNNTKNNVQKDEKGNYINNNNNSIQIDIKFIDDGKTHTMEQIYNSQISEFVKYYNIITFKCTKIEYHNETNKISYMLFEQITA